GAFGAYGGGAGAATLYGGAGGIPGSGGGLPGFPGAPGTPGQDPAEQAKVNHIAFYPTALALVVQGTSRKHSKYPSSFLGKSKPREVTQADFPGDRGGITRIDKNSKNTEVAGGKEGMKDDATKVAKKGPPLDPAKVWQEALTRGVENPGLIIAAADFLFDEGFYDHAAEFLKANLRQGIIVEPWVYEALAIALEFNSADPVEVQRARLSAISLDPKNADSYVKAAKACAEHGQYDRALAFCHQASALEPGLPTAYAEALVYAEKA